MDESESTFLHVIYCTDVSIIRLLRFDLKTVNVCLHQMTGQPKKAIILMGQFAIGIGIAIGCLMGMGNRNNRRQIVGTVTPKYVNCDFSANRGTD